MSRDLDQVAHRVLLAGEDRKTLQLFSSQLNHLGEETHRICSFAQCRESVRFFAPQLVLMFCKNDDPRALECLKQIRELEEYVHVLFVCENGSPEQRVVLFSNAVDEVVDIKCEQSEFLARVRNQIRICSLRDQIVHANYKLRELVDIDDLTGLYNMRSLYQRLDYELDRTKRFGRQLAVVMLDLDHFKKVNDGHDHLFGSYVLAEVGKLIRSCVRSVDIGARYGGDEFLIVLTEVGYEGAAQFCERLKTLISSQPYRHGKSQIHMTASIGFSMSPLSYKEDIDGKELVRRADQALYAAKDAGRNCVKFAEFAPEPQRRVFNKKVS